MSKTQEAHLVIDGPFAETKQQWLGFYLVEAEHIRAQIDLIQ